MNDEEKKAIEYLTKYIHFETYGERSLDTDINTVLNLIEKQEKTIKDLIKWRNYYKSLCKDIRNYKNKVIDERRKLNNEDRN